MSLQKKSDPCLSSLGPHKPELLTDSEIAWLRRDMKTSAEEIMKSLKEKNRYKLKVLGHRMKMNKKTIQDV